MPGHSRLVTNGYRSFDDNNQPVISTGSVGVHNGIVVNDKSIWQQHPQMERRTDVDSESGSSTRQSPVRASVPQAISHAFSPCASAH